MQINVTGQNIELTQAIRDYVDNKFTRLERRYDRSHDHLINTHVVLGVEKLRQKAEATLQISSGTLHAEAEAETMHAAVDALMDKLDRQIKRHKEKRTDHHRAGDGKLHEDIGSDSTP
uniref:Ribosome hibernation promoting factor n=1 Tax=Candidatus Kentrum eta TaxID=2126337 RepID=A0A450UJW1_9GAMM|nr:MAG: putative sigma-54 modulation protein [Candidatus Kentron sp. H]VFJ92839.1 MAG: putative sigma-54 modulation protein [Candidatus Kentron sp. H]VFJ94804.1 MAG: putative sigma-54 modulation protein [Candidatus Kentron sp. H]